MRGSVFLVELPVPVFGELPVPVVDALPVPVLGAVVFPLPAANLGPLSEIVVRVPDAVVDVLVAVVAAPETVVLAAVPTVARAVAGSSQWKGSKLLFGSIHDGFLEA